MYDVAEIKSRLSIFNIAARLGIEIKGGGRSMCSPFRNDRKPSFSISRDGQLFNDFATGDKGDVISFYALAMGKGKGDAIQDLAQVAGIAQSLGARTPRTFYCRRTATIPARPEPTKERPSLPALEWNERHARHLQDMRSYSVESQYIAFKRGVFGFCNYKGFPAWIIADGAGRVAQARRIDGGLFKDNNGGHKAETLKNSNCTFPAGLAAMENFKTIAICEGSTDFLAAFHFAYVNDCENDVAPLAMLGAKQRINSDVLPVFKGKHVIIFPDDDSAGKKALYAWGEQLTPYAEKVFYFDFSRFHRIDGRQVKDLSDFIAIDPDEWEAARPYCNPYFEILNESFSNE